MTQIVDERLKKMCDECHSHLDKPCAWLSLGNEYCEEIMNIHQELQRKDNIIDELEYGIQKIGDLLYEKCRIRDEDGYYSMNETDLQDFYDILDKIKELENDL